MSILRKLFAGVTVLTLIAMVSPTSAITIEELTAQIAALTAQLAALQGTTTTTTSTAITGVPAGFTFTKNLKYGSVDPDVVYLKKVLDVEVPTHGSWTGTSYFGAKVKAAVISFQEKYAADCLAPFGLTAGTGFVGSATRTKLNAILVSGSTGTGTGTTIPTGAGLTVTLASDTPASGTFVRDTGASIAQANASFVKFVFTNGDNAEVKVTTLKLKRGGISSDTDLSNIYLYDGTTQLAEYSAFSSQIVTFTNASGLFTIPAGGSKVITVKGDIAGANATIASINLGITAAADIVSNASAVNGTFPLTGNNMAAATVADLGYTNISATSSYPANVDPGVTNYELWRFSVTASDQDMQIEKILLTVVGTISATDVQNVKLEVGGVAISETAQLASDKTVTFDFSANPYKITKGQTKIIVVKGDVPTGTGRTFKFTIRKVSDFIVKDTQYGVYTKPLAAGAAFALVEPTTGSGTTINNGTLTVSVASDSPSGNIASGATGVTLAKYNVKANGEAIKITGISMTMNRENTDTSIDNAKLYYNGSQVGSASTTVSDESANVFTTSIIIPAGETGVFEYKADITTSGTAVPAGQTITVTLNTSSAYSTGQSSLAAITLTGGAARTLTVASGALSVAKNNAMSNYDSSLPTGVVGAANVKVGSFVITAGAGEGVTITQLVVGDEASVGAHFGDNFQNLKLMHGTTQLGTTQGTLTGADGEDYTFNISPAITLAAGAQYVVDVYADILSGATGFGTAAVGLEAVSVTATGLETSASANWSTTDDLQNLYIAANGSLIVGAVASPTTPVAGQLVMGSSDNTFAVFSFQAGAAESVQITQVIITDAATSYVGSMKDLKLFSVGTGSATPVQIGSTVSSIATAGTATFNLTTPWVIPANTTYYLVLKAGVNSYPDAVGGVSHTLSIASNASVKTYGVSSGIELTETVSGATSAAQDVYRTKLTVAKNASSPSGASTVSAASEVLRFDVTANSNYTALFSAVGLTVSGSASLTGTGDAKLYDSSDMANALDTEAYTTCTATTTGSTTTFLAVAGDCTGIPVGATVRVYDNSGSAYIGNVQVKSVVNDGTNTTVTFETTTPTTAATAVNDVIKYIPLQPGNGKLWFGAHTTLTADVASSSPNLTVASTAGFAAGDTIAFKGYNAAGEIQNNQATIKSVSSATAIVLTGNAPVDIQHDYQDTAANALTNRAAGDAVIWEGAYATKIYGSISDQVTAGTTVTYVVKGDTTGATTNNTLRVDITSASDFIWSDSLDWTVNTYTTTFPVTGGTLTY